MPSACLGPWQQVIEGTVERVDEHHRQQSHEVREYLRLKSLLDDFGHQMPPASRKQLEEQVGALEGSGSPTSDRCTASRSASGSTTDSSSTTPPRRLSPPPDQARAPADGTDPRFEPSAGVPAGIVAEFDRAIERTLEPPHRRPVHHPGQTLQERRAVESAPTARSRACSASTLRATQFEPQVLLRGAQQQQFRTDLCAVCPLVPVARSTGETWAAR